MDAGRLNSKMDVYSKTAFENELGETDYIYNKLQSVWAEILPTGGSNKNLPPNEEYAEISHKITIRAGAIKDLANDMYFMYQGQRYDIKYFQPNYKFKDSVEIMANLVVE